MRLIFTLLLVTLTLTLGRAQSSTQPTLPVYPTLADMLARANPKAPQQAVSVLGYTTAYDGGGGMFYATNVLGLTNSFTSTLLPTYAWVRLPYNLLNGAGVTNIALRGGANLVKATGATVYRALEDELGEVINVKRFGATGDGGSSDTLALQAAVAYLNTNGVSRHLKLPKGTFNLDASLIVSNLIGVIIEGDGAQGTVLNVTGTISGPVLKLFNCQHFVIRNLAIFANKLADRCLFLDGNNTPPSSVGLVQGCSFIGAVNEGIMVNDDVTHNYQGDHFRFADCNFSQSTYNYVQNSGNALENQIENCQFFGFDTNSPTYNIWVKAGGLRITKASFYSATDYDIRLGVGTFFFMDNGYSESDKILTADSHSIFAYPTTIKNFLHQKNYDGDVIVWDRNGLLSLENCRWGGSINITRVMGGTVFNNKFRTGYVFTGAASEYAKLANIQSYQSTTSLDTNVTTISQPFVANKLQFGDSGSGLLYESATDVIFQIAGGKNFQFYDQTNSATRLSINGTTGEVYARGDLRDNGTLYTRTVNVGGDFTIYTNATQNVFQSAGKEMTFYDTTYGAFRLVLKTNGVVQMPGLPTYADNASALAGGLTAGALYRNGDVLQIVH